MNLFPLISYNKLTGSSFNLHLITLPSEHPINNASFKWKFIHEILLLSLIFKLLIVKIFIVLFNGKFSSNIKLL